MATTTPSITTDPLPVLLHASCLVLAHNVQDLRTTQEARAQEPMSEPSSRARNRASLRGSPPALAERAAQSSAGVSGASGSRTMRSVRVRAAWLLPSNSPGLDR